MRFKMWHYHRRTYKTHLEEAAKVGVLDTVLGFEQGTDRESDLVLGQGSGLGSDPESDLVLGLELEGLQAPVLGPPQESDQDTGPGKSQVVLGHLGHDQVSGHHQFHPEAGCTVSGTPLKCGHKGKKNKKTMLVPSLDIKQNIYHHRRAPPVPGMGHISGKDPSAQQRPLSQQHCILLISCEF